MDGLTESSIDKWMEKNYKQMDELTDEKINDEKKDGWMDGQINGLTD